MGIQDGGVKTLLVCGHGRCGSSLMMQMLQSGGLPTFGDYPAFEPDEVGLDRDTARLLRIVQGKAVKILDPQLSVWPKEADVNVIWMHRDAEEQGRSQEKFLRLMVGIKPPKGTWKRFAQSYAADTAAASKIFRAWGVEPLRISFESMIINPKEQISRVKNRFDIYIDADLAAGAVIPRSLACMPGMDIEMCLVSRTITSDGDSGTAAP